MKCRSYLILTDEARYDRRQIYLDNYNVFINRHFTGDIQPDEALSRFEGDTHHVVLPVTARIDDTDIRRQLQIGQFIEKPVDLHNRPLSTKIVFYFNLQNRLPVSPSLVLHPQQQI